MILKGEKPRITNQCRLFHYNLLVSMFAVSNFGLKGATGSFYHSLFLGKWHSYESMAKAIDMYLAMEKIDVATFINHGRS